MTSPFEPTYEQAFGAYFRALRRSRRISRAALAQCAGISLRAVGYWEAGECLPRAPELDAALNVLNAQDEERIHALSLVAQPRARQQIQVILAQSHSPTGASWAGTGDLLRAMRMRQGLTQAQVAGQIGVTRQTVLKWESGESAPAPEKLTRLCALLNAHVPEKQALMTGHLPPVLFEADARGGAGVSLAACEEGVARFREITRHFENPLVDLQALALKQHLRLHCERSPSALPLLAHVEHDHSLWLYYQDRRAEAQMCLNRVLHMMTDALPPQRAWIGALNLAGWYAVESGKSYAGGARVLRQWQSYLPEGYLPLTRYCDTALYAAQSYERGAAARYLRQAEICMPTGGPQRAEAEEYLEVTRARVRMLLDADADALAWLLKYATVTCNASTHLVSWVKILKDRGEEAAALAALRTAHALPKVPPLLQHIRERLTETVRPAS